MDYMGRDTEVTLLPKRREACRVCGEKWNISRKTKLPKDGYLCPRCRERERKGLLKNVHQC